MGAELAEIWKKSDIEPWLAKNMHLIDADKDNGADVMELIRAGANANFTNADAEMVAALLFSFEVIDCQDRPDGRITIDDARKISTQADPRLKLLGDVLIPEAFKDANDRLRDLNENLWGSSKNPRDAIKSDAVGQGAIGDCWLMGAIAAVADRMPETIEKMIRQNADGSCTVQFPGSKEPVTVPAPTRVEMALFARGGKHGTWVAALEKAAAKKFNEARGVDKAPFDIFALHGGDPGEALSLLTGEKVVKLSGTVENIEQVLNVAAQWELPCVAGSKAVRTDREANEAGVYYRHAYTVTYDAQAREVIVRNPWGWGHESEPLNADGTPRDGVADGAFRLSLADFKKSFPDVWAVVP